MRYFNIFSNVMITKGITRILISDLQKNISELYTLDLYFLLEDLKSKSIEDVISGYKDNSHNAVNDYIELLINKEYGFITNNDWDRNFPTLPLNFESPTLISDIIVEFSNLDVFNEIYKSLENFGTMFITIFSQKTLSINDFQEIDKCFLNSSIQGIEIYSPFHEEVNERFINNLDKNTLRINNLIFYSCGEYKWNVNKRNYRFDFKFVAEYLKFNSCGKVDLKYFSTNISKVAEAKNHNSCLHKKLSIDQNGDIRNCPAMPDSFGNIKENSLEEALRKDGFKKYWNITKDQIEGCKDCEFRYVCTDCRAFTEQTHKNKEGLDTSKPLKCGYNPYTGDWAEWSTNPLKQKTIDFYGLRETL